MGREGAREADAHAYSRGIADQSVVLGRLPSMLGVPTRQASAENPTGQKGMGARWDPDPDDPDLVYSGPAVVLGRGWKVRPYCPLPVGEELVLADASGPGVITHLFLTSDSPRLRPLVLRAWWDDEASPSVEVPVGDFFSIGHDGVDVTLTSQPVTVAPARACSCWWPMPFRHHARLTLTNEGDDDVRVVAWRVTWQEREIAEDLGMFHAQWRRTRTGPATPEHTILDGVRGRGVYVGTSLALRALAPGWWGEGEVKVYLDGDEEFPTIVDNGTEDYFGGAWGFGRDFLPPDADGQRRERPYSAPFAGCPLVSEPGAAVRRFSAYRWHVPDPIGFASDIRVTMQALGWGEDGRYAIRSDDVATVAYWYQSEPHVPFTPVDPARDLAAED
jgi:hypothetical protein